MRKVVDSNYLGTEELRDYLSASRRNVAVITDYGEMEMLKADSLEGFLKSTELLAQYPRQVILSKTTDVASSLRGKRKGLKKRLTDGKRTRDFRKWCRSRRLIKRGEKRFEPERIRARREALAHLDRMLENAASFKDDLDAHAKQHYTAEELRVLRNRQPWTLELIDKVLDGIMHFTLKFFEAQNKRKLPPIDEVVYTFVFRFALCAYLHALHWLAAGGAKDRELEKFRNDLVDVTFAAYGTCFDGVLTNDKLATEIYDNAMFLLEKGFLRKDLPPPRAARANA